MFGFIYKRKTIWAIYLHEILDLSFEANQLAFTIDFEYNLLLFGFILLPLFLKDLIFNLNDFGEVGRYFDVNGGIQIFLSIEEDIC